jgi:lysophospholipase L1-like esterase
MIAYIYFTNNLIINGKIENVVYIDINNENNDKKIIGDKNTAVFNGGSDFIILESDNINKNIGDSIDLTNLEDCRDYFLKGKEYWCLEQIGKVNEKYLVYPYYGKTLNCLGDSITFGFDPNNNGKQMSNTWVSQVGNILGFSNINNYGISSTTIATKTSDTNWINDRKPMALRYINMVDADVIGCLGGINDFCLGVPLGTFDSRDTNTFYGALHILYKGLVEKYPTKKIFIMTCLYYIGANPNGVTLDQWTEAQRQVANYYSIPLLDLFKYSGISARVTNQTFLIPDGLHPSQDGANILAKKIANFIRTL